MSVCTGSIILAAAGLLNGLKATSHWGARHLKDFGAKAVEDRYVREGRIITCQGVSAGIDMALYVTAMIAGDEHARAVQLMIEYFRNRRQDSVELKV